MRRGDDIYLLSWKDQEASSAILLSLPLIKTVTAEEVWRTCWCTAKALRRCPAIGDDEDANPIAHHATVGVLLLYKAICLCCSTCFSTHCSRTSQSRSTAAISRLELVSVPAGFDADLRLLIF